MPAANYMSGVSFNTDAWHAFEITVRATYLVPSAATATSEVVRTSTAPPTSGGGADTANAKLVADSTDLRSGPALFALFRVHIVLTEATLCQVRQTHDFRPRCCGDRLRAAAGDG